MSEPLHIAGRAIGPGEPVYIIAEMSANHGHDIDQAMRIVDAAAAAGCDAVKLQTYTADTLTLDCDAKPFQIAGGPWAGRTLHELYREASTPWDWQPKLKAHAESLGLHCFSSPFDDSAVAFLESIDVPAYKIASFELVDLPLIERCAATGKPMIMSTGMASLDEIGAAVEAARGAGCGALALLKCTSSYPAKASEMNLRAIELLRDTFGVPVGLSDHCLDPSVAVAAVALGACMVEKHITLERAAGGPDAAFSLEPAEFNQLVEAIRTTEQALGEARLTMTASEVGNRQFRRSLFVTADVKAGEAFTLDNVRSIRPSDGLPPAMLGEVLGKTATRDVSRGEPLTRDMVSGLVSGMVDGES